MCPRESGERMGRPHESEAVPLEIPFLSLGISRENAVVAKTWRVQQNRFPSLSLKLRRCGQRSLPSSRDSWIRSIWKWIERRTYVHQCRFPLPYGMASEIPMWRTGKFLYEAGHGCYNHIGRKRTRDYFVGVPLIGPVRKGGEGLCDGSLTEYPSMTRNGCNIPIFDILSDIRSPLAFGNKFVQYSLY